MQIRIAVSNLLWLKENINYLNQLNWGVEIQDFSVRKALANKKYSGRLIKNYSKVLKNNSIKVSLHAPTFNLDPGCKEKDRYKLTKSRYIYISKIAKKFKADFIVFHSMIDERMSVKDFDEWVNRQQHIWREVLRVLPAHTKILFENVFEKSLDKTLKLSESLNKSIVKRFGVCFDIGHCILRFNNKDFMNIIKYYKIDYIHVNFNDKNYDEHKPLPPTIFNKMLKLIKSKNTTICLEYPLYKHKSFRH